MDVLGLIVGIAVAVGAFVAAYVAYSQTKEQIKQAALQHEQQLTSTLRPVVNLRHLECGLDNDGGSLTISMNMWLQNVGPGPALQVEFEGWVRVPNASPFDEARIPEIEQIKDRIDKTKPEFRIRLGAIGPNRCVGPISLVPQVAVPIDDYAGRFGIMVYLLKYQDVFENQRPSKPPEEWFLGHHVFNQRGTWRTSSAKYIVRGVAPITLLRYSNVRVRVRPEGVPQ